MSTDQDITLQETDTISVNHPPGDIRFVLGLNTDLTDVQRTLPEGSFRFFLPDGREVLTITPTGAFLVYGEIITNDLEVYETFKAFLECARISSSGNSILNEGEP